MAQTQPITEEETLRKFWDAPSVGTGWCDCGEEHNLTRDLVGAIALELYREKEYLTHPEVVRIAMELWNYGAVCRFFHLAVGDAAIRVEGELRDIYPLAVGLTIVKDFSDRWNGCPEEACGGDWDEYGEDMDNYI